MLIDKKNIKIKDKKNVEFIYELQYQIWNFRFTEGFRQEAENYLSNNEIWKGVKFKFYWLSNYLKGN